jgi:hypothetical protein
VPIVLKSGSLNFLEPSRPVQAYNGIALPLTFINWCTAKKYVFVSSLLWEIFDELWTKNQCATSLLNCSADRFPFGQFRCQSSLISYCIHECWTLLLKFVAVLCHYVVFRVILLYCLYQMPFYSLQNRMSSHIKFLSPVKILGVESPSAHDLPSLDAMSYIDRNKRCKETIFSNLTLSPQI